MANSKGSQNVRNFMYPGKHALLPPKIPFPGVSASYTDCVPGGTIGSKAVQRPRDGTAHHQRTSSESLIIEEQPFWLDDLLNEPDTPVRKNGHRRSSSDSFAYMDLGNSSSIDFTLHGGSHEFDYHKDACCASFYPEVVQQKSRPWDLFLTPGAQPSARPSGVSYGTQEADAVSCLPSEKNSTADCLSLDPKKASPEIKDVSHAKPASSDTETKRAKQQFAQRSRVRKLQYIAELERNVQALQAEGSEVSAELEFLNQQNLILSMENKALKQRLESLAQEHLIKRLEHEVLEREMGRLRTLYKQQQQPPAQQPTSSHRRANSKDLESQLANLSLKQKDASSSCDSVTGSLRI